MHEGMMKRTLLAIGLSLWCLTAMAQQTTCEVGCTQPCKCYHAVAAPQDWSTANLLQDWSTANLPPYVCPNFSPTGWCVWSSEDITVGSGITTICNHNQPCSFSPVPLKKDSAMSELSAVVAIQQCTDRPETVAWIRLDTSWEQFSCGVLMTHVRSSERKSAKPAQHHKGTARK